jgi:hypothetical protein
LASRNNITGDLIKSKGFSKEFDENYDTIFPEKVEVLDDGFGNVYQKCGKRCWLEIVRPGKVQCDKPNCENKGK